MADFFAPKEEEDKIKLPDEIFEDKKMKIGEKEYTQEELSKIVEMGEFGMKVEGEQNTKLDRVFPEFSKAKNENKQLREEMDILKEKQVEQERLAQEQTQQTLDPTNQEQVRQSREAAKKLGIVTVDDFNEYMKKSFRPQYMEERGAEQLLETTTKLESKYDGKDGRPKFEKGDMLNYMQNTGVKDPEMAYRIKNETALDSWKQEQLGKKKIPGLITIDKSTAGGKTFYETPTTEENLDKRVDEVLSGS